MVFTGIIQTVGYATYDSNTEQLLIQVEEPQFWSDCNTGDSISVDGCCLTILDEDSLNSNCKIRRFFLMEETLSKTSFSHKINFCKNGNLKPTSSERGIPVNIEKALKYGQFLGGHVISGHVNGVATICEMLRRGDGSVDVWIDLKTLICYKNFIFKQGNIAINGVSLTIADVDLPRVKVSLIPHTQKKTTFQYSNVGDCVNVELDNRDDNDRWLKSDGAIFKKNTLITMNDINYYVMLANQLRYSESVEDMPPLDSLECLMKNENFFLLSWFDKDVFFMCRAIQLASRGRYSTCPNPWVGALVVNDDGLILGEGYHKKCGGPHAEVLAIHNAVSNGHDLNGKTLYCTLEPCNHFGRTPPCSSLIFRNGFKRVVISVRDPDENVTGNGLNYLEKKKNCTVEVGVLGRLYELVLRPYLYHRVNGLPWVVLKVGMSLDAKIGYKNQHECNRWITDEESRKDSHRRLRCTSQAIVIGSGTAIIDDPKLNIRHFPENVDSSFIPHPYRAILSTNPLKEIPKNLLNQSLGKVLIFTSINSQWDQSLINQHSIHDPYTNPKNANPNPHIQLIRTNLGPDEHVDFNSVLKELSSRNVMQVLVEGGSHLSHSLLTQKLANQLVIYQSQQIIGPNGINWLETSTPSSPPMPKLSLQSSFQINSDSYMEFLII